MIVENTRQDKIKNIIINIANNTKGIKQEHLRKAIERYIDDTRDLDIIEQELWEYSRQIEEETKRIEEERMQFVNSTVQKNVNQTASFQTNSNDSNKISTSQTDNQLPQNSQVDIEEDVNLQETTFVDNQDELSSMFSESDPPKTIENNHTYQQNEKGKTLVKSMQPMSNNRGQATFLNLCFIFSIIAIVGLAISTILIYAQKLFN